MSLSDNASEAFQRFVSQFYLRGAITQICQELKGKKKSWRSLRLVLPEMEEWGVYYVDEYQATQSLNLTQAL